jgi:hypothetical protein
LSDHHFAGRIKFLFDKKKISINTSEYFLKENINIELEKTMLNNKKKK